MMNDGSVVSRADGWLSAWVGDEFVMMSAESGACISLSETGGRIWELMDEPHSVGDLCLKLEGEYEASTAAIREDVLVFLSRLEEEDAVRIA